MTKHKSYSHELKVEAAKAIVEGKLTKPEAMKIYGIKSISSLDSWCRLYRKEGPDALLPKPKGRKKKTEPSFSSREEELEARVQELELENEILKRLNALAEEIKQKRQTRYGMTIRSNLCSTSLTFPGAPTTATRAAKALRSTGGPM